MKLVRLFTVPDEFWVTVDLISQSSLLMTACYLSLFGAKPLPEPMLTYYQLDSWEQISVKFDLEFSLFHSRKCIWNYCLPKRRPFCPWEWLNRSQYRGSNCAWRSYNCSKTWSTCPQWTGYRLDWVLFLDWQWNCDRVSQKWFKTVQNVRCKSRVTNSRVNWN